MLRRKSLPESLQGPFAAFRAVVASVERAKAAITEAAPSTRLPGRPLAEALIEFEEGLRETRAGMQGWRASEVEPQWRACDEALGEALARAERLRLDAEPPAGFEELVGTIGDLLAPLEAFEGAAERFGALRRGGDRRRRGGGR